MDIYKRENSELEMAIGLCSPLVPKDVEVLIPRTSEYDLFGNNIIADNQGEVIMVALLQYDRYPYRKETFGHRCTHRRKAMGRLTFCCHEPGYHERERGQKRPSPGPYEGA